MFLDCSVMGFEDVFTMDSLSPQFEFHVQMSATTRKADVAASKYVFLVEFAVRHPDFQVAELESVLDMFDVRDVEVLPLPAPHVDSHRPFCILSLPLDSKWVPRCFQVGKENDQKEDIGRLILDRCTLVRSVIEMWGAAPTIAACVSETLEWTTSHAVGQRIFEHCADASQSWKCTIQTLGTKYSREDQDTMRLHFSKLNFKGPVRMKENHNEYVLIREIELNLNGAPVITQSTTEKAEAVAWYYGRALGNAGRSKGRLNGKLDSYSLKKRSYLGPTSMDAELSSIMTNLGQVRRGHIVLDPFCGTGSILLSCGLRGAFCVGTDIDIRVIRGHSQEKSVVGNFFQYKLPRPEIIRCDNHSYKRHWRLTTSNLYDAIVCDPPYGIRAGARKSGSKRNVIKPVVDRHDHMAPVVPALQTTLRPSN